MTIRTRWLAKLHTRRELEQHAREHHLEHPTSTTRALLKKRRTQVAYAVRVLKRHSTTGVKIVGNRVTGGTPRQRLKAAAEHAAFLYASGKRPSFYSQPGAWTVNYGITGEPRGYRSDCSQWVTSIFHSCGLPDPNGTGYTGGFTGTLKGHGREISRSQLRPGDLVVYGAGNGHHVEMYVGPGDRSIGHGTSAVDPGSIYMQSQPHFIRPPGLD